ncbi:MAG TPA: prepilin-type N-terminal cleavage/methylation domain-containing protein [Sumerlaeia bacterium]|nr:prepilin-type N-terminal cleavage/methylation domain-containing protein [Sumerlaeia bacterium]
MKKVQGFTLIELLIVVAIIAILAAIAVPNFLEAQVRSKVSRVHTDMRSVATALEAYMVDNNMYVASWLYTSATTPPADRWAMGAANRKRTFRYQGVAGFNGMTLTTPVSFMTNVPNDTFAGKKGSPFNYWNFTEMGWILWSFGPDGDDDMGPGDQVDELGRNNQSVYNPALSNPTLTLLAGPPYCTYDPTNGTTSNGDVWRVKQ